MSQFLSKTSGGSPVSTSEHSPSPTPDYIPGCFEGPEKTMEVCFIPGIGDERGLRALSRKKLDYLCTEAKCSILSKVSNSYMDAYVLSESSLFVYKHRYIMKTCGTTTLLHCLDSLLRFADELKMELMWVGYSRKNLLFPTQQAWPHSNFGDEIEYLNSHKLLQDRLNGVAHILGPVTGDHWFVYVADNPPHMEAVVRNYQLTNRNSLSDSDENDALISRGVTKSMSTNSLSSSCAGVDLASSMMTMEGVTMNMMMFDLDATVSKLFYQPTECNSNSEKSPSDLTPAAAIGKSMTKASGIDHLVPGAIIDESSFCPCGYSMNAILHDAYSTIHVTPEPECSYASFETNTTLRGYSPLVRNVLNVFGPKRFVLTMFADEVAHNSLKELPTESREFLIPKIGMYQRTNLSCTNIGSDLHCTMACYSLVSGGNSVPRGLGALNNPNVTVQDNGNGIFEGGDQSDESVHLKREREISDPDCRRARGNTVDLTTENHTSPPPMPMHDQLLAM